MESNERTLGYMRFQINCDSAGNITISSTAKIYPSASSRMLT